MDVHLCIFLAQVGVLKIEKSKLMWLTVSSPAEHLLTNFIVILGSLSLSWRNLSISGDNRKKRIIW